MALGDDFPIELYNTTDLVIERPTFSADYGDEVGAPTTVFSGLSAIAIPARQLSRDDTQEQSELISDIILNPALVNAAQILEKDVARWTDFEGSHEGEVRRKETYSGVPGMECVVLKIQRQSSS